MANTSSINLLDLDFFSLKTNFKNYLRNQPQFRDYDFDGSNMNVLLDILAYNTFKNSFYTNMLFSEAFLDTAQLRGSLISHAKELNYNPASSRSSKARIKVDFEATSETQPYIVAKGSTCSAIVKSTNFTFSLPETMSIASSNNSFSFETDIYEGVYVQDSYVFRQVGEEIPRFRVTNKNIDTDSLTVTVFSDNSANGETYSLSRTLLDLNFKSKVYFLQCNENEFYEIYFGDDILGKKPTDYSTIVLDYRISSGPVADNALQFVLNFNPTGANNELLAPIDVTTVDVSKGGQLPETTESIRFYAPRAFQIQERTVTAQDYETALKIQFPEINAVYAYGGEEANPPMFGRVFVAIDISNVSGIPDSKKREYANFLKNRAPFSIEAIFIEPEYAYLSITANVRYNINVTKIPAETMKTIIRNTILNFRDEHLNDFNVTFRDSKLANAIDDSDISIISSTLDVLLYKKVDVRPGVRQNIVLKYNCALLDNVSKKEDTHPATDISTFSSSLFRFNGQTCIFEDNGEGTVRLVTTDGIKNTKIFDVGSIDYDSGLVSLDEVMVDTFLGSSIKFYARTRDADITTLNNTILTVEDQEIHVNVQQLASKLMDAFGATISNLIQEQFPAQYREHGPMLVTFVTEYYKWLESTSPSRDEYFVDKVSLVAVANKSANVIGKGTFFKTQFANGDPIAISKGETTSDYDMFVIKNIANNTFLTLRSEAIPNFTHANTRYATVSDKPNALYITRNFPELHDVDETLDKYVIYFKEKYLKGARFRTITDTRKLIKHSLDLYRSKGTERSIDLIYKAVFGKPASVYYPGQDIFRLSSGDWYIPHYLELTLSPDSRKLINKQIVGVKSGATAFVEEIIRCVKDGLVLEIAYISAINGIFITGEKITLETRELEISIAPTIIGSLNEIEVAISGSGIGFAQNDIVDVTSVTGRGAKGKVLSVANTVGQLTFQLLDGGYGYVVGSNETQTYVSDNIVEISNATFDADYSNWEYVPLLNQITQPLAYIHYENANGDFAVGNHIFTWSAGSPIGEGEILSFSEATTTSGYLTVSVLSGDLNEPAIYTTSNGVTANLSVVDGYTNLTVTANVIGNYGNVSVVVGSYSNDFIVGEEITQPATQARGTVTSFAFNPGNTECTVYIENSDGTFINNYNVTGSNSLTGATVLRTNFSVGVINTSADFYTYVNNYVYSTKMRGTITGVSLGTGAGVTFANTVTDTEDIVINTDIISPFLPLALNVTWPFAANPTANMTSTIDTALTTISVTIGKITALLSSSPGTDYNRIPLIKLVEPDIWLYSRPDTLVLTVTSIVGFQTGELITQAGTNARGKVEEISGNDIVIQNMRFYSNNLFTTTSSVPTKIIGSDSGASSNVVTVGVRSQSTRMGDDIEILPSLSIGEGAITSVKVLDSGFGFLNGEQVTLAKDGGAGTGFATLSTHGTGTGYYRSKDGFLSDTKKLSDGWYWQEYSYEVRSSVIDDFKRNLRSVVHVAGTKYFDALYYDTINSTDINSSVAMTLKFAGELRLRDGNSFLLLRNGTDKLSMGYEH